MSAKKRGVRTRKTIVQAMDACTDHTLYLAMNLAFARAIWIGEILGYNGRGSISTMRILPMTMRIFLQIESLRG